MSKSWIGDNFIFTFFQVVTAVNRIQGVISKGQTKSQDWPPDVLCLHVMLGEQSHLKQMRNTTVFLGDEENLRFAIGPETTTPVWRDPVGSNRWMPNESVLQQN